MAFKKGREDVDHHFGVGRPVEVTEDRRVALVWELLNTDRQRTFMELSPEVHISSKLVRELLNVDCQHPVHRMLTQHLEMGKIAIRWVPYHLLDVQK